MALRLHRVTDDAWQRLAATRRGDDVVAAPPRTTIGAIESEIRSLGAEPAAGTGDEYPHAAAG